MGKNSLLDSQKVLVVDDEPDVLESVDELLPMCHVEKAGSFEEGKELLETRDFDIAILDIMGVDGYKLLEIAKKRKVISVMLTAQALSPENIVRSFKERADSYLPKFELSKIAEFLTEILQAKAKGRGLWSLWLDRWGAYYDKMFGSDWQDKDRKFWEKFKSWS